MTKTILLLAAILVALTFATPVAADEPHRLAPSSPWNLDYAEDKCRLIRQFGEGEERVELHFEQSGRAPYYNLALFGEPLDHTRAEIMRITFGPHEGPSERSFLAGELKETEKPFIVMHGIHLAPVPEDAKQGEFSVVEIGPERERAITELTLERGLYDPLVLELGSLKAPLDAMRTCVEDLMQTLELDPESVTELVSGPKPKNRREFARQIQEFYPPQMLDKGAGGTVAVRLTINKQGEPTSCQIAKSDRPAAFDDFVCFGLMRTAEFEPAIGPDGEPRYGFWSTSVVYVAN